MTPWKQLSISAFALSMFAACGQSGDAGPGQAVQVRDPDGAAQTVTVLDSDRADGAAYAEVVVAGRDFTLAQWLDTATATRHSVVTSSDGGLRYEYIADPAGSRVVLSDRTGTRTVPAGGALGSMDRDAATLLMNFRPAAGDGVAYQYDTYCVGYDTSDPSDWHLTVFSCTCAHWYSVICYAN